MATDKSHEGREASDLASQNLQAVQKAMGDYFQFWQRALSSTPWANPDFTKKMAEVAQQNMARSFDFAQQLAKAKNPVDALQIQTKFFQAQLQSLNDQAKDLGDAVAKVIKDKSG